jgi:hypothetical protein
MCHHDLTEMAATDEEPVGLVGLGERERPIDYRAQAVHLDSAVHRLEIDAAADADRAERDAAAAQQIDPVPSRRASGQARPDQADMSAHGQGPYRHRDRAGPADLDGFVRRNSR